MSIINSINQGAIRALDKDDFLTAQSLFRQSVKRIGDAVSLNNLGAFYLSEGMLSKGGIRKANKLSLKYLLAAENNIHSNKNLMAIGEWFYRKKKYDVSVNYLLQAYRLKTDYILCNNIGVSLFLQKDYTEAANFFKEAYFSCDYCDDLDIIGPSYVYSIIQYDKRMALDAFNQLIESSNPSTSDDRFILPYLCEDLNLAEKHIGSMFDSHHVNFDVLAMVFDCLEQLGKIKEAKQYLEYQLEYLNDFECDTEHEIKLVKKAYNNLSFRAKAISGYRYIPNTISTCYYIGCYKHMDEVILYK